MLQQLDDDTSVQDPIPQQLEQHGHNPHEQSLFDFLKKPQLQFRHSGQPSIRNSSRIDEEEDDGGE